VYFDPSPSATTELFAKLKAFYSPPTPVSGIGDEAYIDPRHGLHVRKGNVRFFLDLGESEKQIKDLASDFKGVSTLCHDSSCALTQFELRVWMGIKKGRADGPPFLRSHG
jgi:hypothetical protein